MQLCLPVQTSRARHVVHVHELQHPQNFVYTYDNLVPSTVAEAQSYSGYEVAKHTKLARLSRIINCTAQIFAQAYKTRRIPGDQARTSVI